MKYWSSESPASLVPKTLVGCPPTKLHLDGVVPVLEESTVPALAARVAGMDAQQRVQALIAAYEKYAATVSQYYDEMIFDVIARVNASGHLSKLDIAALVGWKRLRADTPWMSRLMATPDTRVCAVTAEAVRLARDETVDSPSCARAARSALCELDGLGSGDAVASAVCYAAAPHRLAVYDRRAHVGVELVGLELTNRPGRYGRYIQLIENLREELRWFGHTWSARHVDLALYQLGARSLQ